MNFGKWIVVAYVVFAAFIGTLVTVCVKQDISLVSKSYYKDELGYQDQIVRIKNANGLVSKPHIEITAEALRIQFASDLSIAKGELKLFCPSDPLMDKSFVLALNADNAQSFDMTDKKSGMYKARLSWTMSGKEYFMEKIVYH